MAITARGTLRVAIRNALRSYDARQKHDAVWGFLDDLKNHPGTNWIAFVLNIDDKLSDAYDNSREAFEQYLRNFKDQLS